jgi:DNA mismatch repair protein MSH6
MAGSAQKSTPKQKQGTLFSFFSKKPSSSTKNKTEKVQVKGKAIDKTGINKINKTKESSKLSVPTSKSANSANANASTKPKPAPSTKRSKQDQLLASINAGMTLSVFWPADQEYYTAKVTAKKRQPSGTGTGHSNVFTLLYDDGEVETIDLTNEKFKIVEDAKIPPVSQESQENESLDTDKRAKKRKIIFEESEEEFEFDDQIEEGEDSEEEYAAPNDDDDEDDDEEYEAMDVTNDEDDEEIVNGNKASTSSKKRVLVTSVKSPNFGSSQKKKRTATTSDNSRTRTVTSFITPPPKSRNASGSKTNAFASFASDSSIKQATSGSESERKVTPLSLTPKSVTKTPAPSTSTTSALPQAGVVNQAGNHWHNHFEFLKNPRDKEGRPASHKDYDPRTLKVDFNQIIRVTGSKITPASQQWWDIKAQYADTFLLFKTGKFYEIFHMDADVAVQHLNFAYMKGQVAHAGFPEIGYGGFCERLVKAGYKVARVEQTETPDMLKERKKKTRGKKPQVVNREVCSIVSAGTRTFCYLDDVSALEKDDGQGGIGPLLVIKESMLDAVSSADEDSVQPVCEYGITLVDAATGTITLGQFADDVLRNRMNTLLTKYRPSEILMESGSESCSKTLQGLIQSMKNTILPSCTIGMVNSIESFPNSMAIDANVRAQIQRTSKVKPWDKEQTLKELHRRGYYPRASRKSPAEGSSDAGINRWPGVLKACVQGGADLAISSFGAALFYLQRSLIDEEIFSMGVVKAYIPPDPATVPMDRGTEDASPHTSLTQLASEEQRLEDGIDETENVAFASEETMNTFESEINHMSLDGTTIANLEILANTHSNTTAGSLWSKVNYTKSPFGSRLLRAWLLRPLFRKVDIDRRADAVEELASGAAAAAMSEARDVLAKCGDMERLLSRVHSMSGNTTSNSGAHHPNERAVLYEAAKNTRRKVGDFSKLLNGLRAASQIPELFDGMEINSGLLNRIVRTTDNGGLFPSKLSEHLDWFFDNFDCGKAAKGLFEPARGMDDDFDEACDAIDRIKEELEYYKNEMCSGVLRPSHLAKQWKYANTKGKLQ